MVLVQKWPFFQLFFFRQDRPGKVFYGILERKNAFLGYKNKKLRKSKKWDFSKGVSLCFLVENWSFLHVFILDEIGQENVFYDILVGKNPFLGYENKKLKKLKNWDFSKGVSPWFWSKVRHFCMFLC